MKRFKNKNVVNEEKRLIKGIVAAILIIAIAFGFKFWASKIINKKNQEITDLNTVISSFGIKELKKAYVEVATKPYKFARYKNTNDSYYIVSDNKYLYILYMNEEQANTLSIDTIEQNPLRVEGITQKIPSDVKKLAIDAYNDIMKDEQSKLTLDDFDSYFGNIYLDLVSSEFDYAPLQNFIYWVLLVSGTLYLIISIIRYIHYNREIFKLSKEQINEIEAEMDDENALFYNKVHLYLTENYIINFSNYFRLFKYEDILWLYPTEQKINGIKSCTSIKAFMKDGKTYELALVSIMTKANKDVYDKIWNTIINKNDKMLVGYNEENIKIISEMMKNK